MDAATTSLSSSGPRYTKQQTSDGSHTWTKSNQTQIGTKGNTGLRTWFLQDYVLPVHIHSKLSIKTERQHQNGRSVHCAVSEGLCDCVRQRYHRAFKKTRRFSNKAVDTSFFKNIYFFNIKGFFNGFTHGCFTNVSDGLLTSKKTMKGRKQGILYTIRIMMVHTRIWTKSWIAIVKIPISDLF